MQCEKCGIHIENMVNFCPNCGEKMIMPKRDNGKLNLESHVNQVMEEALKTAWRGNRKIGALDFLCQIPVYLWCVFIFLLCAGYYFFF